MKTIIYSIIAIVVFVACFLLYTFATTGFFRDIVPKPYGEIVQRIPIKGAEDLTISYEDHFMIISADDRKAEKMGEEVQGGIYYMDLDERPFSPVRISDNFDEEFHPHGISLWKIDSAAYTIFVVNHTKEGHAIEKFRLENKKLRKLLSIHGDPLLKRPNDIVAVDENRFYFTNDHGYSSKAGIFFENYLGLKASGVVFYDGEKFHEAADGIGYANGITIDTELQKVYVASSRYFCIKVYQRQENNDLEWIQDIETGSGVDNLEWDNLGNLWVGSHPNLLRYSSYAALNKPTSPSEVIRIRFDGNPSIASVFVDDGNMISAASVAAPFEELLFIGTIMDDNILVLKR